MKLLLAAIAGLTSALAASYFFGNFQIAITISGHDSKVEMSSKPLQEKSETQETQSNQIVLSPTPSPTASPKPSPSTTPQMTPSTGETGTTTNNSSGTGSQTAELAKNDDKAEKQIASKESSSRPRRHRRVRRYYNPYGYSPYQDCVCPINE
jgi:hypothetical protein